MKQSIADAFALLSVQWAKLSPMLIKDSVIIVSGRIVVIISCNTEASTSLVAIKSSCFPKDSNI